MSLTSSPCVVRRPSWPPPPPSPPASPFPRWPMSRSTRAPPSRAASARSPSGCPTSATTPRPSRSRSSFPTDHPLAFVSVKPVPGWNVKVTERQAAQAGQDRVRRAHRGRHQGRLVRRRRSVRASSRSSRCPWAAAHGRRPARLPDDADLLRRRGGQAGRTRPGRRHRGRAPGPGLKLTPAAAGGRTTPAPRRPPRQPPPRRVGLRRRHGGPGGEQGSGRRPRTAPPACWAARDSRRRHRHRGRRPRPAPPPVLTPPAPAPALSARAGRFPYGRSGAARATWLAGPAYAVMSLPEKCAQAMVSDKVM